MQAHSVVKQWTVVAIAAVFVLPTALGLIIVLAASLVLRGSESALLAGGGVLLMLLGLAVIVACLLSLTIRATVGPDGISSGEVGGRWTVPWPEAVRVWIVSYRGQQFLAVLPAPGAKAVRTAWRGRRMGLPEGTRTVRIAPESVSAIVRDLTGYRGVPPETHVA